MVGREGDRRRLRIRCTGAVQGVGFRPTVYRVASGLGLGGFILNDPGGVTLEVEGAAATTTAFPDRLRQALPPLARVDRMEVEEVPPTGATQFEVRPSAAGAPHGARVPADTAVCSDCRDEMANPEDRRFRYPFITCTNCGPRFSLVRAMPYDRSQTAMACFDLCPECAAEYTDPADRRFHAEPVCCPTCGPRLWLADATGEELAVHHEAIAAARSALEQGRVVAVKGLGGFQLACRADLEPVVDRLRERKHRPRKPFAVMVRDLAAIHRLVEVSGDDIVLLQSPRAPIVLARRRPDAPVARAVAPGLDDLGVMLPTTPLHHELLADTVLPAVVMTSGNRSEEPLCRGNREALARLGTFADVFLLHDRDVVRRVDDSVIRTTRDGPVLLRRARGWVPEPLPLPVPTAQPVLAVGGHLQVTVCVAAGELATVSQHIGDLDGEPARGFHREVITGLEELLQVHCRVVAADPHPDYPSSWLADELVADRDGLRVDVQHHLAHLAATLGEHGRFPAPDEVVAGIALDGTGYGDDGTAWGGEWLCLDGELGWRRRASLAPLPLVGGETAVREPWRVAVGALVAADRRELVERLPLLDRVGRDRVRPVLGLADRPGWPLASGAGRLFEAAGAILGLVERNDWEGEAAAAVEAAASRWREPPDAWDDIRLVADTLPSAALLTGLAERAVAGEPVERAAAGFHHAFCRLAVELSRRVFPQPGPIALGGGCLVNRLLRTGLGDGLAAAGYEALLPTALPPGDGGLAYGQVVVAAVAANRGVQPRRLEPDSTRF